MMKMKTQAADTLRLISKRELCRQLSASEASIDRWVRTDPDFPQARKLGPGSIRWLQHEVNAFVASLARAEYDDHAFDPNEM